MSHKSQLLDLFHAGIDAARPEVCLPPRLPRDAPKGRTIVLGFGKAAAAMAEVAHDTLAGDVSGCVVTRYGHGARRATGAIEVIEASHPVPDDASRMAGARILRLAREAGPDDRVIFLVSGGGSALLSAPAEGLTLRQKAEITDFLVKSGAAIDQINLVRRHLSSVKGGRLAAAAAARGAELHTLIISDVVGDNPAHIASGPTVFSPPAPFEALDVLSRHGYPDLARVEPIIRAAGEVADAPHPIHVVATAKTALLAVDARARELGWTTAWLGTAFTGDAGEIGKQHADLAKRYIGKGGRHLLLSGGELTVKVTNPNGRGGANSTYLAALMSRVDPRMAITALAGDSDGIDGSEDNAGAWFDSKHRADPSDCAEALASNSTYDLFRKLGTLVVTGPTRTNVNDIRLIAVEG